MYVLELKTIILISKQQEVEARPGVLESRVDGVGGTDADVTGTKYYLPNIVISLLSSPIE